MSAQIQEVLQRMQLVYIKNLPQQLDAIEALILELREVDDDEDCFEDLYRAVHTLKGTAGTYGLQIISDICTPFEDCLTAAHEGGISDSERLAEICVNFIDLIRTARSQAEAGEASFPEIEAYLADIQVHGRNHLPE